MSSDDDSLWHYTSLSGFLGILKDQEIWVTDIRFLNDASELYHFLDRMGQTMKGETAKYGEWDYYLKHWLSFKPLMGGLSFLGVACFSGRKDDLSQWRGYTAVGQGVALRFDRVRLDSLAKAAGYQLIQCNYDELDSQKAIDEVLGRVRHAKPAEAGQPQRGAFSPAEAIALNLGGLLLTLAAQRKDPKFESEQEVRLISPRMGAAAHSRQRRQSTRARFPRRRQHVDPLHSVSHRGPERQPHHRSDGWAYASS